MTSTLPSLYYQDDLFLAFDKTCLYFFFYSILVLYSTLAVAFFEENRIIGLPLGVPIELSASKHLHAPTVIPVHAVYHFFHQDKCVLPQFPTKEGADKVFQGIATSNPLFFDECFVFDELLSKSFWIMNGLKYGSTFVIYKQHPDTCHSLCAIQVVPEDQPINPRSLISLSRLCVSVKKTLLLATVNRHLEPHTTSESSSTDEFMPQTSKRPQISFLKVAYINLSPS